MVRRHGQVLLGGVFTFVLSLCGARRGVTHFFFQETSGSLKMRKNHIKYQKNRVGGELEQKLQEYKANMQEVEAESRAKLNEEGSDEPEILQQASVACKWVIASSAGFVPTS